MGEAVNQLDYKGITTTVKFDPSGELAASSQIINLFEQKNGQIVILVTSRSKSDRRVDPVVDLLHCLRGGAGLREACSALRCVRVPLICKRPPRILLGMPPSRLT